MWWRIGQHLALRGSFTPTLVQFLRDADVPFRGIDHPVLGHLSQFHPRHSDSATTRLLQIELCRPHVHRQLHFSENTQPRRFT